MDSAAYTVYFAKTNFRGAERTFGIRTEDRRQHTYVIGKTGTGKTNLLKNLAFQDIQTGAGLAIVDPHGSFVEEVLEKIPDNRLEDVIYFNPSDSDFPLGFNVLEVPDPKYKHLVASDLMGIFTKIWANVWSSRMEYILNNCVLALLDTPGTTLLGIPRLLVDKGYRRIIIDNLKDPVVRSFWVQEYESWQDRFRQEAIAPIQNKVGQFLSSSFVRNIVGQPKSAFNVQEAMNQRKILLINVAKGRIGEDNAALLGAMLITKIQLAAMERVRIPEDERKDFYLYVDEFQNFATDSFANILSEARKYRLNLVIAHQYIGQLVTDTTTKVRDAVFGNCGTLISFRVGATDAEFLEKEFEPEFEIQDLVNLPNRHIYLKLMVNGATSRPFSATTIAAKGPEGVDDSTQTIIDLSRRKYARPREVVESEIMRWSESLGEEAAEGAAGERMQGESAGERTGASHASGGAASASKGERYTATCSLCGKPAHLNFKPDESRPIYCSDCLKKVQAGEIAPAKVSVKAKYPSHLSLLGIEFAAEKGAKIEKNMHTAAPVKKTVPSSVKSGALVARPQAEKTISLKELSRTSREPQQRKGPDLIGLKEVLKNALGGSAPQVSKKETPARSGPVSPGASRGGGKPIAPGEKIKL
ncbi:MAG: type IV secretion system DNA-binding domain-containing protein [Patescibacteria group bacterium]